MSSACKWNRYNQSYDCDQDQAFAILKAAAEKALDDFVEFAQEWRPDRFLPFYEAHPDVVLLLGVLAAIFFLRHRSLFGALLALLIASIMIHQQSEL